MKRLRLPFILAGITVLLHACVVTDNGVGINTPNPQVNICLNSVSDTEAEEMRDNIAAQTFKDDKLDRAKLLGNNRCFMAHQVVILFDAFDFEDNKLEIAKYLYTRTEDRQNYTLVVDALIFQSDRDELRDYMETIGG